ncbi:MAG: 16S rRNA (cytosine(1402)-N(4))-methyltransferase RsmH [Parcubacteria group bacterium]|nr:16S rRNA (cytosine(1402)-N(4))-methyltransferase RsmH [Parcubacteria group bacterium]
MHTPVLLKEVLEYLNPKPNQNFIDATVGDGGHAKEILKLTAPFGMFLAIDRDIDSIIRARANIEKFGKRVLFINDSFGNLGKIVKDAGISQVCGILFDFGMSSSQLENSGRGFSFKKDEILDMRFDAKNPLTAEDIINNYGELELLEIFKKWGEEPKARLIAKAIVTERKRKRIKTTGELVKIVESVKRRAGKIHPATLIFQALRIEVNEEFSEIEKALSAVPNVIKHDGRAAFISFHSLEDRIIKNWIKKCAKNPPPLEDKQNLNTKGEIFQGWGIKILNKKPIVASAEELKNNPRSRSAKLRTIKII